MIFRCALMLGLLCLFPMWNAHSQTLTPQESTTLIDLCTKEHAKIKSLEATGTLHTSGTMFRIPDEAIVQDRKHRSREELQNAFSNSYFRYAFKNDNVSKLEMSISAADETKTPVDLSHYESAFAGRTYYRKGQFYFVTKLRGKQSAMSSHRQKVAYSLLEMGFVVPYLRQWPETALQNPVFHIVGTTTDSQFGKLYEITGKLGTEVAPGIADAIRFWVAPEFGCRVVRTEVTAGKTMQRSEIKAGQTVENVALPKAFEVDYYDNLTSPPQSSQRWNIDSIVLNQTKDSDVIFRPAAGDTIRDIDADKYSHVGMEGNLIPVANPQTKPRNYPLGWLFMASVTTLLLLTVASYIRWKRKQWEK